MTTSFVPVANQVQAPSQMTLGDMINVARGAQAYKQAQQLNPLAVQQQQLETQKAEQGLQQSKLETKQKEVSTENAIRTMAAGLLNGHLADPDFDINHPNGEAIVKKLKATQDYWKSLGYETHSSDLVNNIIKQAKDDPQAAVQAMRTIAQQQAGAAVQAQQLNAPASYVNTGQMAVPIYQSPYQGGGPGRTPALQMQVSPSSQESIEQDAYGNKVVVRRDAGGNIIDSRNVPASQGGFQSLPQGETAATAQAAKEIQLKSNMAAASAPNSMFNSNKIISLADKAFAGAGADILSKLGGGYAALPWTSDRTTNMQILGHQMSLETANLASQAGLGTDAARGLAEKMAGTTNWTPEAIKQTARMNRALATGSLLFNEGINNAVKNSGNNPFAAREFQNKWSAELGPNLVPTIQFIDAVKNKDTAEIKKIVEEAGGRDSKEYKQLLENANRLDNLIGGK